jgi:hypothetical protein
MTGWEVSKDLNKIKLLKVIYLIDPSCSGKEGFFMEGKDG